MSISQDKIAAREAARAKTGEFGFQQHAESDVTLSQIDEFFGTEGLEDYVERRALIDAHKRGLDDRPDTDHMDLAQEVYLQMLEAMVKAEQSGEELGVENMKAYSQAISKNVSLKMQRGKEVPRSYHTGMTVLNGRVGAWMHENGRSPSKEEYEQIKDKMLQEWGDSSDRPPRDFDSYAVLMGAGRYAHLAGFADDEDHPQGQTLVSTGYDQVISRAISEGQDTTGALAYAEQINRFRLNSNSSMAQRDVRQNGWRAISRIFNLPDVAVDSVPYRTVMEQRKALREMVEDGPDRLDRGFRKAMSLYQQGEADEGVHKALFFPFGTIDDAGKDKVIEFISSRPRSEQMAAWDLAVGRADRKTMSDHKQKVERFKRIASVLKNSKVELDKAKTKHQEAQRLLGSLSESDPKRDRAQKLVEAAAVKVQAAQETVDRNTEHYREVRPSDQVVAQIRADDLVEKRELGVQRLKQDTKERLRQRTTELINVRNEANRAKRAGDKVALEKSVKTYRMLENQIRTINGKIKAAEQSLDEARQQRRQAYQGQEDE